MLNKTLRQKQLGQLLFLLLLQSQPLRSWATFGNEYVHIKVHVPKEHLPTIAESEPLASSHNVVHHFHHHPRARNRPPPPPPSKPKSSPLLESVILADLDKPLHTSEHADYLNHAKELAEQLSDTYVVKKLPPTPPPKKKVNTYTVIEEQHRGAHHGYDFDEPHSVETYRVIDTRLQHHYQAQPHHQHNSHHHHHAKHQHSQFADSAESSGGYHYQPPSSSRYQHAKPSNYHSSYAEPAPVVEPGEHDTDYQPPIMSYALGYTRSKTSRSAGTPLHTLLAPEQSTGASQYSSGGGASAGFRPSPQLYAADIATSSYDDDAADYAAPLPTTRRRRPELDWPTDTGYNSAAPETYHGVDSYNAGHVQGVASSSAGGGYQFAGPYAS